MTTDQILLFSLFAGVFGMLLWGKWRYDIIAFSALLIALVLGLVTTDQAFSGFGHPATIIVALVLVISRGLLNSGAIDLVTKRMVSAGRSVSSHIMVMSGVGAVLAAPAVPVSAAARTLAQSTGKAAIAHALSDGEDFELLFTCSPEQARQIVRLRPCGTRVSIVGEIVKAGYAIRRRSGPVVPLEPSGYEHRFG